MATDPKHFIIEICTTSISLQSGGALNILSSISYTTVHCKSKSNVAQNTRPYQLAALPNWLWTSVKH